MDLTRLSLTQLLSLVDSPIYSTLPMPSKLKILDQVLARKLERASYIRNRRYVAIRSKTTLDNME